MRLTVVALLALALATPVLAVDAVSYKGTLGTLPIIAELATTADGAVAGRYSYLRQGGDIPLSGTGQAGAPTTLTEEAPCTQTTCLTDENGDVRDIPVGAHWTLTPSADGARLTGRWQAAGASGKSLDIRLERIGQRTLDNDIEITPMGLADSAPPFGPDAGAAFDAATAPYDHAKMDVPLETGATETLAGSNVVFVTDPRTGFAYPRVAALADGSSADAINRALTARHNTINAYAFDCLSRIYAGFGANQYSAGMGPGTLGDFDAEQVTVHYLSPTLMSWTESGSTFCGGAYPNNHADHFNLDVRTGAPLPLARVFKDWLATHSVNDYDAVVDQQAALAAPQDYVWQAGPSLIDYVRANRAPGDDAEFEAECGIDALIGTNLGVRFAASDTLVFVLEGLPHVIFACSGDLLSVELDEIAHLLAPTAADYFPALAP